MGQMEERRANPWTDVIEMWRAEVRRINVALTEQAESDKEITRAISAQREAIQKLTSLVENLGDAWQDRAEACPHRVAIARSSNNADQIRANTKRGHANSLSLAKVGLLSAAGGSIAAGLVALAQALL